MSAPRAGENFQDWEEVVYRSKRPAGKKMPPPPGAKVESFAKYDGGRNKQNGNTNAANLERKMERDDYVPPTISANLKSRIQQERAKKKWTQQQLANACNLDVGIIKEIEAGKGMPNHQNIQKIGRALGVQLSNK